MLKEDEIKKRWPLHWMVWNDDPKALERTLKSDPEVLGSNIAAAGFTSLLNEPVSVCLLQCEVEKADPRGRTPLHLAVTLGRVPCVEVLLRNGANTQAENRHRWSGEGGRGSLATLD